MSFLYLHIPFCEVKCGYCDFFSLPRGHGDFDLQRSYVDELIREIHERLPLWEGASVQTIFFGGGTPSLLEPRLVREILGALRRHVTWDEGTEITMEANPKTVSLERLRAFRELGVNRLSIGVQSFEDRFLKILGRIHSGIEAERTVRDAFEAGFKNVNLDLIYALPGQSMDDFQRDLDLAISLKTPHLSLYNLTIEEGTPFERQYGVGTRPAKPLLDEETQRGMFEMTRRYPPSPRLRRAGRVPSGLLPYEISNFARQGFECRHNLNYWNYGEWMGFGAGATSFITPPNPPLTLRGGLPYGHRTQNVRNLKKYLNGDWAQETEEISLKTAMQEFLMMGLRKTDGIRPEDFKNKFGRGIEEVYGPEVKRLEGEGWLVRQGDRLRLSEKGLPLANEILVRFL